MSTCGQHLEDGEADSCQIAEERSPVLNIVVELVDVGTSKRRLESSRGLMNDMAGLRPSKSNGILLENWEENFRNRDILGMTA